MNKALAILLLAAAVAVQAKFIPEIQDAIVRYPELLRLTGAQVDAMGRKTSDEGKIIGGTPATAGQFPHQCHMSITSPDGTFFCGCSVINEAWILTAAHCVDVATTITVTMGDTDRSIAEGSEVTRTSNTIIFHENWRPNVLRNDVAVVGIDPVTLGGNIERICLAPNNTAEDLTGEMATVSGWGKTSDNSTGVATQLSYIDVPVITNTECSDFYGVLLVAASNICTSTADNKGTCNGDSGGPLTRTKADGTKEQIGIVSFGSSSGCTAGPSAFARVSSYNDWIVSKVGAASVC